MNTKKINRQDTLAFPIVKIEPSLKKSAQNSDTIVMSNKAIDYPTIIDDKSDKIYDTLLPQKPAASVLNEDKPNQGNINDTFNIKKLEEYINNDELIMEESNNSVSSKYFGHIKDERK